MKITETTTLAELQSYLKTCGDPFITLMAGHPHGAHPRHVIIHVPVVGTFHGGGSTVAEALEAAFIEFRRATLPEPLKQYAEQPIFQPSGTHRWLGSSTDYTPCCAAIVVDEDGEHALCGQHPTARVHRCHGCGELPQHHPNETGCKAWHDKP